MRVYNMQQRKPNGKGSGRGDIQTSADDEEKDLEYKAVYHQTYKGTMFAFVSGISSYLTTCNTDTVSEAAT